MGILVREADLPRDSKVLLSVLLRNRNPERNGLREARFDWSYFSNPYGVARAWLAIDESSGKVIGMASAFPRRVWVRDKSVLCWNTGDFSIDREFRTLGVALKLRRAEKSSVDRGETAFLYCYPMDRMRVVLERVGHFALSSTPRHRIILKLDELLERCIGANALSSGLARVANLCLLAYRGNIVHCRGLTVQLESKGKFGKEYDELFERVRERHSIITVRDSQFLTWRFLQSMLYRSIRIFRMSGGRGVLRGYAVLDVSGRGARVLDLLVDDESLVRVLLHGIIRGLRSQGVCRLAMRAAASDPVVKELRSFGMVCQDSSDSSVMAYAPANSSWFTFLNEGYWFMTQADRDV
jgi:hypothetical protein